MYDFAIAFKKGDRIQLDYMTDGTKIYTGTLPVPSGTQGTVTRDVGKPHKGCYAVYVDWDNGSTVFLTIPPDAAHLIEEG